MFCYKTSFGKSVCGESTGHRIGSYNIRRAGRSAATCSARY